MGRLDDRVAIVTGSGRGIGRATALRLARDGAAVVVMAFDENGQAVRDRLAMVVLTSLATLLLTGLGCSACSPGRPSAAGSHAPITASSTTAVTSGAAWRPAGGDPPRARMDRSDGPRATAVAGGARWPAARCRRRRR